jgi:uncharacterized coiled-coil protein SlyX
MEQTMKSQGQTVTSLV